MVQNKVFEITMNKLEGLEEPNKLKKNENSFQNDMTLKKQTLNSTVTNFQSYNGTANFETILHRKGDFVTVNSKSKPQNLLMKQSTNYPVSSTLIYSQM